MGVGSKLTKIKHSIANKFSMLYSDPARNHLSSVSYPKAHKSKGEHYSLFMFSPPKNKLDHLRNKTHLTKKLDTNSKSLNLK